MRVLVTGGSGLVGRAAINHLLERGHTVRLFCRDAERDARQWPSGVEARPGDVGDDAGVRGSAEGCEAVLHLAAVAAEDPPAVTFQNVNIEGTRRLVREAERAGVRRFVYVSSLGAERGSTAYHHSKFAGEQITQSFDGDWLICRPGNVYGPGDHIVSVLLKMVRSFPVLPTIEAGDREFQPVWVGDLGEALALAVERDELSGRVLELAGPERTSPNELLDRLGEITGRRPLQVPVPEWVAVAGSETAAALGIELHFSKEQITMLHEGNVIADGDVNALTEVFGIDPTPLREGLVKLVETLPERLPGEGMGPMQRQRHWADIANSPLGPDDLFRLVCEEFGDLPAEGLLEVGVEADGRKRLEEGAILSLAVPLRGHVQVRIEEIRDRTATAVTLQGHLLSGVIRFCVEDLTAAHTAGADGQPQGPGPVVRFEIRSYTRPSSLLDRLALATGGQHARKAAWESVVEEVVRRSGGRAQDGVRSETEPLDEHDAAEAERWVEEVVLKRQRTEMPLPHP